MVKLLSIILFNIFDDQFDPVIIHSLFNLGHFGFFERNTIQEICIFASREYARKCSKGCDEVLNHMNYNVYVRIFYSGLAMTCVTDDEYPMSAAKAFLNSVCSVFMTTFPDDNIYRKIKRDTNLDIPQIQELLITFQEPNKADKFTTIRTEIQDTKITLIQTIDTLLERGESLDSLMERTNDLSLHSKIFLIESKKMNSCCILF